MKTNMDNRIAVTAPETKDTPKNEAMKVTYQIAVKRIIRRTTNSRSHLNLFLKLDDTSKRRRVH